jgi:PAS domain S-box-containing protein
LTIVKVNRALSELLGYPAEEIEGSTILDHACEEHIAHWHHLQEELWSKKVPFFKLRACLYTKDRGLVWVDVTTILYEDQGETFGFTVLDDVSGIKNFEESQKRLTLALKYSGTALWELNLNTGDVFRSEGHDEIFGYTETQSSWSLESYYPHLLDADLPEFKAAIESARDSGAVDIQLRLKTADHSLKWINFKGKTEVDEDGAPGKLVGAINDITQDKVIERHKDDFISIASHELKTPVTSLKASLQLIDKIQGELSDRMKLLLVQTNKGINRIAAIIDDLLNAGRNYQQQLALNKSTFKLYDIALEACSQFNLSGTHAIALNANKELLVNADAERIGRVLTNLIGNSVKYAPNSAAIKVDIEEQKAFVKISVTDEGPGINPEKIPLLFNRYYQAQIDQMHYTGLGLGLFISADIVRKHGGEIGVDSIPGMGSTFWFTLPK